MTGGISERGREMLHPRPVGQRRIVSGEPAFDRNSNSSKVIDAAPRRVRGKQACGRLTEGAGVDGEADGGDAPVWGQCDIEGDAAPAGTRAPLNAGVRIGEAGLLRGGQREPQDIAGIERAAHSAAGSARPESSFSRSATTSDRAALVARSSG